MSKVHGQRYDYHAPQTGLKAGMERYRSACYRPEARSVTTYDTGSVNVSGEAKLLLDGEDRLKSRGTVPQAPTRRVAHCAASQSRDAVLRVSPLAIIGWSRAWLLNCLGDNSHIC